MNDDSPYTVSYDILEHHIDFQGILDGLHFPYYFENCRHAFVKDQLQLDLELEARNGVLVVLSQYTLRFKRSVKAGEKVDLSCSVFRDLSNRPVFHLYQQMQRTGKVVADAIFTATFVRASGGRSFLPEAFKIAIASRPALVESTFPDVQNVGK